MSHIFISYSRQDQDYVALLTQALKSHHLPVWLDDHINYGTTWPRVIRDHVEQCAVFLVVMSPRSEESMWVQNELTLAQKLKKPVFPLLLEGDHWFQILTIQSVDVTGGKLPPARFFDTLRPYFPTPIPAAESLRLQTVVEESISSAPAPAVTTPKDDDLSSEKDVDYCKLRDLLKTGQWKEADKETDRRMLQAVDRKEDDYIRQEELLNFPCADLRTIDALWVKYSQGKWGFSVQKRIYVECGAKLDGNYPSDKIWHEFCRRVGWRKGDAYVSYSDLTFDLKNSSAGEFPRGWSGLWCGLLFFSRTETCKL